MTSSLLGWTALLLHLALQTAFILRALLRPHREPSSRMAWVVVILVVPVAGMIAYLLLGETSIGRQFSRQLKGAFGRLPPPESDAPWSNRVDPLHAPLFRTGQSISGFPPVAGNAARLLADSNAGIDAIVADIDAAREHVHLLFYIWLADTNGLKVAEAAKRAAARGVTVRAMADNLGSRALIDSPHWTDMAAAGVKVAKALPIGNPLLKPFRGRIDLRNHRKIVVIDHHITYCGSQNCADPEFRVKAKYAPWVDLLMRFEGPVARQNQWVFAVDWMTYVDEDMSPLLRDPVPPAAEPGIVAQVIATGPTVRESAMPEMFAELMHAARDELILTTPYFVPNEAMQSALRSTVSRGVETTLVVPARNDSWIVAAASRSYYEDLLEAGIRIFEYSGGLLHAKSLTFDGQVALIGSANLDRRSFDLNYENNILIQDAATTATLRERQMSYVAASREVSLDEVRNWSLAKKLGNNTVAMFGPVL